MKYFALLFLLFYFYFAILNQGNIFFSRMISIVVQHIFYHCFVIISFAVMKRTDILTFNVNTKKKNDTNSRKRKIEKSHLPYITKLVILWLFFCFLYFSFFASTSHFPYVEMHRFDESMPGAQCTFQFGGNRMRETGIVKLYLIKLNRLHISTMSWTIHMASFKLKDFRSVEGKITAFNWF